MHLIRSTHKIILSLIFFSSGAIAQNEILAPQKQKMLEYSLQQAKENSSKTKKDWINSIYYKYNENYAQDSSYDAKSSTISVDQPIFKSGGIYEAIKYANSSYNYSVYEIQKQRKELISTAINLLFQIDILKLQIKQQKLLFENAKMDVERKKEQVINGLLDASYLDNALLEKNEIANNIFEMEYNLEELINSFSNISDKEYNQFPRPKFSLINEENFIQNNLNLLSAKALEDTNYHYKGMILAKYLPSFNLTYNYTYYHDKPITSNDETNYNYGFYISVPLNVNMLNDYESNKLEYLISKQETIDKKIEASNEYKSSISELTMLDKKIHLAVSDEELYSSLVDDISSLFEAGLKTQIDVETLKNSQYIKKLDKKVYSLQKQIILLNLYSKVNSL